MTTFGSPESGGEAVTEPRGEVLSRDAVAAAFDVVQEALTQQLVELEASQPELMTPTPLQLEHAKKVAKALGGMEVIQDLSARIFNSGNE